MEAATVRPCAGPEGLPWGWGAGQAHRGTSMVGVTPPTSSASWSPIPPLILLHPWVCHVAPQALVCPLSPCSSFGGRWQPRTPRLSTVARGRPSLCNRASSWPPRSRGTYTDDLSHPCALPRPATLRRCVTGTGLVPTRISTTSSGTGA